MKEEKKEIEIKEVEKAKISNETPIQGVEKDRKGFAIASMILGIVSIVLFCLWFISIPCGILAIIFGVISIKSTGKGMAIAGIITGGIGLLILSIIITFSFIFGIREMTSDYFYDYDYSYNYNYKTPSFKKNN